MRFVSIKLLTIALILTLVAIPSASCQSLTPSQIQQKINNAQAQHAENRAKVDALLSNVIGLDLTQYTESLPPPVRTPNPEYPINESITPFFPVGIRFDGENVNYTSRSGTLRVESFFLNDRIQSLDIRTDGIAGNGYIYSGSPPIDTINQAKSILERYQTFVSKQYSTDGSNIASVESLLMNATEGTPKNETIGSIQFQIVQNGPYYNYDLKWVYLENGVSTGAWKRIEMRFNNNALVSFEDTWSSYQVSGPNIISSDEAYMTALVAAQDYNSAAEHPDATDVNYSITLEMAPYRNETSGFNSSTPRDSLTVYPVWKIDFYLHYYWGLSVWVWGDTREVANCSPLQYSRWPYTPINDTELQRIWSTQTPTPKTIPALADNGTTVTLTLNGNITAQQITNAAISSIKSAGTNTVSFNVTGTSGDTGLCKVTIPKSLMPDGSTPIVQIDNQTALNQDSTQDANNYYVWYTTHFSTHTVTIAFGAAAQTENLAFSWWAAIPLVTVLALIAVGFIVTIARHKKNSK